MYLRLAAIACAAACAVSPQPVYAQTRPVTVAPPLPIPRPISIPTAAGPAHARLTAAAGIGRRPAAILLHGLRCVEQCGADFQRYATLLADQGVDAYVLDYYDDGDRGALQRDVLVGARYAGRFKAWTGTVRQAIEHVATRPGADGRVVLVGFSQGGRIAIASAADNARVAALVVLYARLPSAAELSGEIGKLPPLLLLHGVTDSAMRIEDGNAIFAKAQALGGHAEMVAYPGVGHGFDFSADAPAALDARRRVKTFVQTFLAAPPATNENTQKK